MKKKKRPKLRHYYKETFAYLKESINYIYLTIALFVVFGIIGFIFRENLTFLEAIIDEIRLKTLGLSGRELIWFILQNNFLSSLFALVFGIFFGVMPVLSSIFNGALIGYVLGRVYDVSGTTEWWRLLPHGVFELPAIFISIGLGIKLGYGNIKNYFSHHWKSSKILLLLPLLLGIIFSLLSLPAARTLSSGLSSAIPVKFFPLIVIQIFAATIAFFYAIFLISVMISDKKFRALQEGFLKHNISNALVTFILIVVPLLIIAAIIEGLLIAYLG